MFDARLRPFIDPPLARIAWGLSKAGVTANQVTIAGFAIGMLVLLLIPAGFHGAALAAIGVNRLADGVDGALARLHGPTDVGGYLDIVLDFIFYSAVVLALVLAHPEFAVEGAFLIFSFIGTGTSFLAFSIFATKRNITTDVRGKKSFYYLGGLTEGFETIVALILMTAIPAWFGPIAVIFGGMCWITTVTRVLWAWRTLRD